MSTTQAIFETYSAPRRVIARLKASGADDGLAMTWLIVACILIFVARLPSLSRTAHLAGDDVPFFGLALGTFFGTVLLAPLAMYLIAAGSHLIAQLIGGKGGWLDARLALFWSLLAITPLVLFRGLIAGFIGEGQQLLVVSILVLAVFLFIWINTLIETERG